MALDGDTIEVVCCIEKIRYYKEGDGAGKEGWGIVIISIENVINGTPYTDKDNTVAIKGVMPKVKPGDIYHLIATFVDDPRWGGQYNIDVFYPEITFDENDKNGQKRFISALYSSRIVNAMYDTLKDPYKVLDSKDAAALVSVKGIGSIKAIDMITSFHLNKSRAIIYSELADYHLSRAIVERLVKRYKSPEYVVEKVKTNPYILADEVEGIGWTKADEIAIRGGMDKHDPRRVAAYVIKYLKDCGENGESWITSDELLGAILEKLDNKSDSSDLSDDNEEPLSDETITTAFQSIKSSLWFNEDKTEIGLKRFYDMEKKVGQELIRLRDSAPIITEEDWKGWQKKLRKLEEKQGWEFTDEQKNGIYLALTQNIVLISGMAGTGKSSLVSGVLSILKNFDFVQCALSGRAASRLSEITGQEGSTIHRLLGYPANSPKEEGVPGPKQQFAFHDENPLPYSIYILDEISMVDTDLFYYLLRAIPSGAKLICLGDHGQLESIGAGNIAHDMMYSKEIPTIILTKIHRQAEASGIISEALKIRRGQQIVDSDWVGHDIRGELKDLELETYSDANQTYFKIMQYYVRAMAEPDFDLMQTQIIVPMRVRGQSCTYGLNNAVQEIVNPPKRDKQEIVLNSNGRPYILREGDKVINIKNNYQLDPTIYNGNIGIVKKIDLVNNEIIVDFVGIGEVKIPKYDKRDNINWKCLELGYAITGHRYQGSEANTVIVGIDFSAMILLSREWLYTAITRAKKKCVLVAQTSALRYATKNEGLSKKRTHLCGLLHELCHPKLVF